MGQQHNLLLILDLDETLVYATTDPIERPHDFLVGHYYVYKRPFVDEFLQFCLAHFDVAIWTSSTGPYANNVVLELFQSVEPLKFVFSRRNCVRKFNFDKYEEEYIKDLKKAKSKGYSLNKILIIDDTPAKLRRNYGNLIRINEWTGDENDAELHHMQEYLLSLKESENVRKIEKRLWRNRRNATL